MSMGDRNRTARWTAAACLAVAALALALSACGDHSPAATAKAPKVSKTTAGTKPKPASGGRSCASQVGDLLTAMDSLRTNLVAGVSYEQYVGEVKAIRGTYHRVPTDRLALGCLEAAGSPGENALNKYIEASNAWSDCVEVPSCESVSVEPALQSRWRQASKLLSEAQRGLKATRR